MAYSLDCNWRAGFVMDPTKKQRVGYLLAFEGVGLAQPLVADIEVFSPFNAAVSDYAAAKDKLKDATTDNKQPVAKITCVGVIESLAWNGGVGDPIQITAMLSSENALQLKAKLQTTLKTTAVSKLQWWIVNFDEENKKWFEESYPLDPVHVTGQLNAPGKTDVRLWVADEATKVASNIDVNVHQVMFEIVPAANSTYVLGFSLNATKKYANAWGLKVGAQALAAVPA
ncbi:MAG: hypothetical protein JWN04_6622 [Myxococcaceae bacterium]|nr:hypothetical protein [Myxococcaceae bacterium]